MVHRRERGKDTELSRIDGLLTRLDDLEVEIARLELQIVDARGSGGSRGRPRAPVTVGSEPDQTSAEP